MINIRLGTTYETLTALDALPTPVLEPNVEFQEFSDEVILGDGSTRGVGFPNGRLIFALLEDGGAMHAQLKSFCPGKSAPIFVSLPNNDGIVGDYSGIMHWPLREQKENNWIINLALEFTQLVEIVET
jgi:hypothetical protein